MGAASPIPDIPRAGGADAPAAGPAHREDTPVLVSVIVPTYNNMGQLAQCLEALCAAADADTELIVVDDASRDDVSAVAARSGARFLRLARNSGPSAARNHGAGQAQGQILFFVDADVVVAGDALGRVRTILDRDAEIAAVFGSYDARPAAPGLISQYRNLLHHYVHQRGKAEAATFWAGCGAVRRSAFEHVGGFDEQHFPRWVEDVELGYRLRRAGYRIFLDKSLQGTHLKRWTLRSMVRTDILHRAIPWARLILESGVAPNDLNLQGSQKASVALTGLGGLFLAASPFRLVLLLPAAACAASVVALNRDFYAFLRRLRGTRFAAACVPLHLLYFACCGLGYQYVRLHSLMRNMICALPKPRRSK
jgi:GT2 family glycosyltransferase